jgi:hypothetical protein
VNNPYNGYSVFKLFLLMESTRGVKRNKYVVFDGTKQANINQHLNYFSSLFSNFPVQFLVLPPP